jgi:hypothetical protein
VSLNLIPRLRGHGNRRAIDKVAELRDDVRSLLTFKMAADDYFALLTQDRDEVYRCWRDEQALRQEAEEAAARMQSERDGWRDEALALRTRFGAQLAAEANADAVTVSPAVRDTSAFEDQATEPIKVLTLQQAFGGTDPAQVPAWAARDDEVA